ncbi:hypothetical protein HHK36_006426 [Tetracentron sinense]|uniref:Pyrroline-5-carboxylate reductase catalytic N-terminal domain-containing protein n=1 Tax=Tetracentron sinense TaxID=13715 RepID=A0A835DP70_TETSI|nr:hypothetical protein HHK36_006426 [Tetracentron sinense]
MISFSSLQPPRTRPLPLKLQRISHCFSSFPPAFLSFKSRNQTSIPPSFRIRAIDVAQPYDYEAQIYNRFEKSTKLKIAVVGFGNFGQFLARTLVKQGHTVLAHSRSNYSDAARKLGVSFFFNLDDLCEEHPEGQMERDHQSGQGWASIVLIQAWMYAAMPPVAETFSWRKKRVLFTTICKMVDGQAKDGGCLSNQ